MLMLGLAAAWVGCGEGDVTKKDEGKGSNAATAPVAPDGFTLVTLKVPNMT